MKWGIFTLSQVPDQSKRVEAFDNDFRQFELAEDLGYDTVWIAEHLFSSYCIVNSCQVLAAAIARRTRRIKIGTAVVVVPFNHPLRTAGDFALVDILSHGRLLFGAGRAYNPTEFAGLDLPIEKSREMYAEGLDIIVKAWTQETISYDGEFWKIRQEVPVLPKPVQQPHPPIYQAITSPESYEVVARDGWHMELAATFSYRFYREAWKDRVEANLEGYENACVKHGRDPKAAERMLMIPFFVAETTAKAKELHGRHVEWFFDKLAKISGSQTQPTKIIKGYELSSIEGPRTVAMGYQNFEKLHQFGAAIAADPDTCIRQLKELKARLGITEFCLWFNMGGVPSEPVERSMRLAAEKVLPYV
jgi:alkanesulfonate monooxygenase SsuD/methylene tetrahydromethanopterin reductase-like flavin-dependent oxidoreductase (luciferase family)